jgi:deoxyribodipyrimidine photolyase-related protein
MGHLRIILPDQLDRSYLENWIERDDTVLLAETGYLFVASTHKRKLAFLCAAGRHFARQIANAAATLIHHRIEDGSHTRSLAELISEAASAGEFAGIAVHRPGSFSELSAIEDAAERADLALTVDEDPSFFSTPDEFAAHISGRKQVVMEYFYRELRKRHEILMDGDTPAGGDWNYDKQNRETFGKDGPGTVPPPFAIEPDELTEAAIAAVNDRFPDNPGSVEDFRLPVTPDDSRSALEQFISQRLPEFGTYQDAMWTDDSFLFHSHLSPLLNTRLLDPRETVSAALKAWRDGKAPIHSVEGFVRQILGWREFIRGVYYHNGPEYLHKNELAAEQPVPRAYWDGETQMACVGSTMDHVLKTGYAHHIQRLMVLGLLAQLAGVDPNELHQWHLSLYLDAYDWVSAPNVIGMSQYADGGFLATKPYVASGKYINRMSNYCRSCVYSPDKATGEHACPVTTLYWDFLSRHKEVLDENRRMTFQMKNVDRKSDDELQSIRAHAKEIREQLASTESGARV